MLQNATIGLQELLRDDVWQSIKEFMNWGFHWTEGSKSIHITIGLVLLLLLVLIIANYVLKMVRQFLTRKMQKDDKLKFISVFKFINYVIYVAVILFTMSAAGIDVTVLITASAVLFVGLGLALQELFQDLIGGIFIIIDKSLRVGDIVEVDGKVGKVFEIKLRTTRAITRDDKVVIIPNHKFISDTIFNYTQNHSTTRENIDVGVAYESNVKLVSDILLKIASEQRGVLKNPKPFVLFEDFGDSALLFSINFFVNDSFGDPRIKSEMRFKINKEFRQNKVTIPFPQRDVHIYQQKVAVPNKRSNG
jgi:small-conductance mechanosensitive channel